MSAKYNIPVLLNGIVDYEREYVLMSYSLHFPVWEAEYKYTSIFLGTREPSFSGNRASQSTSDLLFKNPLPETL